MHLYHGSYLEIKTPNLDFGRFNLDFGKGFYLTTLKEQAEKWAIRRAETAKILEDKKDINPIINIYDVDFENLSLLKFDGYCEQWLDFVVKNRGANEPQIYNNYDVFFGNVADDDVARAVDDYMELLIKGRVNKDVKNALLYQLQFSKPNDQYCFLSEKGINALRFVESYIVKEKI